MNAEFPELLRELVRRAKEIRRTGIHGVDPGGGIHEAAPHRTLDRLVYELYELTPEAIALVDDRGR